MNRTYQVCTKCVMDTSDEKIIFDEHGICNHCHDYEDRKKNFILDPAIKDKKLTEMIDQIKKAGQNKQYDCIVGISGGVDSSYVAYLAKQFNLRTLLVHLDNGWNSELAVKNIENIVKYTGFDLYTIVIDWEEFKDLQKAFFEADVIDIELLSDHAIFATMYKLTRQYKVDYLLNGFNFDTENTMPPTWNHIKYDLSNIKDIHKKFGSRKIKTFPTMSITAELFYKYSGVATSLSILNYINYNKDDVISILQNEMGWQYYGGKHYESIFTRFYQGYILQKKFGIDKRRAHHSSLIHSGQMSREDALKDLQNEIYPKNLQQEDYELVCKKLNFSYEEMEDYLQRPPKSHFIYKSDFGLFQFYRNSYKVAKKIIGIFK